MVGRGAVLVGVQSSSMTNCPTCSAEIPETAKFCPECGAVLKPEFLPTEAHNAAGAPDGDSGTSQSDSSHHGRFLPGTKVGGRYRIVSLLGKGGMGEVYRADDLRLGHTVALKFLPKDVAQDAKRLQYFHSEVRLSRQVSHPNVCRVYDIGDVEGQHFLSMEYIDGEDLRGLVRRIGRLPKDKGIQLASQLCAGLAAAHEKGVLHRDLKPANIMIDGRGQARITDFGLAQLETEGETGIVGTPAYMAPEQLAKGETSIQSDLYSLGLVLYEMFTGERVHKSGSVDKIREEQFDASSTKAPSDIVDDIDPAVERVIARCLEREPGNRPKSALAAAASLPGGDPLAAALAAGETPSPEIVAAVGGKGMLTPIRAAILLGIVIAGLGTYALLRDLSPNHFEKPPGELAAKAEAVLEHLGLTELNEERHIVYGYRYDQDLKELPRTERESLGRYPEEFWYRVSSEPLTPCGVPAGPGIPRLTTLQNPPPLLGGMVSIRFAADGRLREFLTVTKQAIDESSRNEPELTVESPMLKRLFESAGLELADFRATDSPDWTPPTAAGSSFAWTERSEGLDTAGVRVEAASTGSHVVYFQVISPWTTRQWTVDRISGRQTWGPSALPQVFHPTSRGNNLIMWALVFVAVLMTRKNLRLGRCDIRGSFRVGVTIFALMVITLVLEGTHLPDLDTERLLVGSCIGNAIVGAICAGIGYAAIEPYVRRLWPHVFVAWSRILMGRVTDALVGRDILFGVVTAVLFQHVFAVGKSLDVIEHIYYPVEIFSNSRYAIAQIPFAFGLGVLAGLFHLTGVLVLRLLCRNDWLAGFAWVLLHVMSGTSDLGYMHSAFFIMPIVASTFLLLKRFGLVACAAFWSCNMLFERFPITGDASAWYFSTGLLGTGAVLALAVYACFISCGVTNGRALNAT